MKLLSEFFPVFLFFLTYKLYGIYWATGSAIIASVSQVLWQWFKYRRWDHMQLITMGLILLLGGATLLFHNEWFIKWKPTAINWAFAVAFLISQFVGKKPLIQRLMEVNLTLTPEIWKRLNLGWVCFFLTMGTLNIYVAYNYPTDTWVNFKLFGILGFTVIFVVGQAFYLMKYIKND